MRDPNLYYAKNGQRQCKKCKQNLGKEYRKAHRERLKKMRREKLKKLNGPRKQKSLRIQVKRREEAGGVRIEGAEL